ncbi:MAG: archease [Candidatus Omnitrophica bacterium]|nr:archease [Candidatus Omnitrophota bacterium]
MKNYEIIEHTADIGIRVRAKSLNFIFINLARAMFDIIAQKQNRRLIAQKKIKIKVSAETREELLVNWLNDILSLSCAKQLVFHDFKIDQLSDSGITSTALGSSMKNYKVNTEIKAATYHQLKIERVKSGWKAEVIFDV